MPPPKSFVELVEAQQEGKISNVIGTVIDALPLALSSRNDHMLTFTLYDGTLEHGQKCRLFARKAQDLPQINGLGDVVLLKRARYSHVRGAGLLSSTHGSPCPWVVFHSPIPKNPSVFRAVPKAARFQVPEITKEEIEYVISLGQTQDRSKFTPLNEEVKAKVANMKKRQTCHIKDLMLDSYPQIVGEVVKVFFNCDRASLYITDYTENQLLYSYGMDSEKDQDVTRLSKWPGPPGKYTLLVECWPPHSDWIREHVSAGTFLQLENVHIKSNREHGRVEGALHASKHNQDQLRVRKLEAKDVSELLYRKEMLGWADGFDKRDGDSDDDDPKGEQDEKSGKTKSSRNQRKRKKKQAEQAEQDSKRTKTESVIENALQQKKELSTPYLVVDSLNKNIRCENKTYPQRTVAEIRDVSCSSKSTAANDQENLDELTSYAIVRVVDFKPGNLEDFAKAREMTIEEQQQADEINSPDSETEELVNSSQRSANSLYNASTQVRRQIWEWKFALLLQDASSSTTSPDGKADTSSSDQIIAYVSNTDAEYLLGMKALDLRHNQQTLNRLRETLFLLWGDLEEYKERKAARVLGEISTNTSNSNSNQNNGANSLPFKCIIEEFGANVGSRIERKYKIKGTTIMRESTLTKQTKNDVELEWDNIDENNVDGKAQTAQTNGNGALQSASLRAPRAG